MGSVGRDWPAEAPMLYSRLAAAPVRTQGKHWKQSVQALKIISTGMGSNRPKPRGKGATGSALKCINTGSGRYQDRP